MTRKVDNMERIIREILQSMTKEGQLPFRLIIGNKKEELLPYYDQIKDIRMDNSNIENRYIAVLAVDNDTGLFYGGISFIFFLLGDYDNIQFWKRDNEKGILKKVTLKNIMPKNYDMAMTMGYSLTSDTKNVKIKYFMINGLIKIVKEVLKLQPFVFFESTGNFRMNHKIMSYDFININNIIPEELIGNIGVTRLESKAVDKFAKLMGFKEMRDYYNLRTLGKVFVSG